MTEVEQVVLYEDRASVTRVVAVPTTSGRHRVRLGPVSPLVSLERLAVIADVGLELDAVHIHRESIPQGEIDSERAQKLAADVREAAAREEQAQQLVTRLTEAEERSSRRIEAAHAWTGRALLEEDALDEWVAGLRALSDRHRKVSLDLVSAQAAHYDARAQIDELSVLLDEARGGSTTLRCFLELVVRRTGEGELRVRYTIPCALWRPVHRARLHTDSVDWELGAMAWNATGEDWTNIELVCSTARPGEQSSPPVLVDDELRTQAREREVVVEARDETIEVARPGKTTTVQEVPGVDDGGEPRTFTVSSRLDLPSTGRPVRVALESWSSPAKRAWVCTPELSPQVVLRTSQNNTGSRPLLAGPVDLFRDSGAVGRSRIGFVAPGEPFEMGWGSHDGVRVRRRASTELDRARISGRQTQRVQVDLTLSHTGKNSLVVELQERLPVSELKEVTVSAPEATPALHDVSKDGFCTWRLGLQPGETREASLSFQVEASSHVRLPG